MINCYVVDDEKESIDLMLRYIERTPGITSVGSETDPVAAFHKLSTGVIQPEVVFMDISMPDMLGTDLAAQVNSITKIIFTSALSRYAIKAFEIGAIDFLEKPISYPRFLQAVNRLYASNISSSKNDDNTFFIKGNKKGVLQRIVMDEILFVESNHNYSNLVLLNEQRQTVYLSLMEMELALPAKTFVRVHKSYIVNINKIEKVERNKIFLLGREDPLNYGYQYKESFLKVITEQLLSQRP